MTRKTLLVPVSSCALVGLGLASVAVLFAVAGQARAVVIPAGPQNDVPVAAVLGAWGWTAIYHDTYSTSNVPIGTVFGGVGTHVMLAARQVGSPTFDVLAAALTTDVQTYTTLNTPHAANASQWYYNGYSIGFAGLGDTINQFSADTNGPSERDRLSWHGLNQHFSAPPTGIMYGWRSGNHTSLNASSDWERWVLTPTPLSTTVPVGNAGNAPDSSGFGAVAYNYRIGTSEVTNAQYAQFLNAKAASDPLGLYNPLMGSDGRSGITRSGASGSYTYTVKPNMGDKPVNYVSWYDAARFANWMHNGQGAGDTETGAYTLLDGTPTPTNGGLVVRNAGAEWFLPSEDEWYKAAYHQPAAEGGDSDDYWLYPTKTNTTPTSATADSLGNISNPGSNVANFDSTADWNGNDGNVTTVTSASLLSESFYGTYDQGGNVWEWNEGIWAADRILRGGSSIEPGSYMASSMRSGRSAENESYDVGFRIANIPEPTTFALATFGFVGLVALGWRRKR